MAQYKKHYTREEASQLLPEVKEWLEELKVLRDILAKCDGHLKGLRPHGEDLGGPVVERQVHALAGFKTVLARFQTREIQIKDLDRGLIDFPSFIGGKEVFLCWEQGEEDIEFWHDLDAGYAGRERL